jgi:hypothetical protein
MANVSNNPIESFEVDWSYDPLTGKPFSGESVQTYIRANMELLETKLTQQEIQNLLNLN